MIKVYITGADEKGCLYLSNDKEGFVPIYIVSDLWETHVEDLNGLILRDDDIRRIINYLEQSLGD